MSLILDALRKSEAERRRGQSPDLFAATPGAPAPGRERPRVWPLLSLPEQQHNSRTQRFSSFQRWHGICGVKR